MKRIIASAAVLAVAATSFTFPISAEDNENEFVVYYTNDVHCKVNGDFGYAALSALKKQSEEKGDKVLLADAGDSIQGAAIGALTDGAYIVDMMKEAGYDIAIPGNHEFDYGMDNFLSLSEKAQYDYICSNFINLSQNKTVFMPYVIEEFEEHKIAFIGITTPKTFSSSTPSYFQNTDGEYIYSFGQGDDGKELYENIQASIDSAKADGADIIIGLSHLGIEESCSPWMSTEVIANTSGLNAVIDGHSHSVIPSEEIRDKDGSNVILTSTGSMFNTIGEMRITADGEISTTLISEFDATACSEAVQNAYKTTSEYIGSKSTEFDEILNKVVAESDIDLLTADYTTETRLIRNSETNLGNLCADAYREIMGADIGFVNGGGIRADINVGEITYGDIIAVHPFGNMVCLVEATGQQILDALELSVSAYPDEYGGFLQVSGLTYELDSSVVSTVTCDEFGAFTGVDGERRIKKVFVGGTPLDPQKTYTLAGHNYMLKNGGDGYTMFKSCNILKDELYVDNEVLIKYITENLGGVIGEEYSNLYGEGRFKLSETETKEQTEEAPELTREETVGETSEEELTADDNPKTGDTVGDALILIGLIAASTVIFLYKRNIMTYFR